MRSQTDGMMTRCVLLLLIFLLVEAIHGRSLTAAPEKRRDRISDQKRLALTRDSMNGASRERCAASMYGPRIPSAVMNPSRNIREKLGSLSRNMPLQKEPRQTKPPPVLSIGDVDFDTGPSSGYTLPEHAFMAEVKISEQRLGALELETLYLYYNPSDDVVPAQSVPRTGARTR